MNVADTTRIVCALVLASGIATAPLAGRVELGLLALALLVTYALERPGSRWLASRVGPLVLGIVALLVPLWLTGDVARANRLALRAFAAAWCATLILSQLTLPRLAPALRALGVPLALRSAIHTLVWQLEHVAEEGRRLILARELRQARRFGPEVLSELLVRTAARAERVDLALRLRGVHDPSARSRYAYGALDVATLAACLGLGVALHWLGRSAP